MTELGFIGAATGMALMGLRPVIEVQFADFISTGFDAIVQYAATTHYRWRARGALGDPGARRRRTPFGPVPQPEPRGLVRSRPGSQGRGPGHPRRRQGPADRRDTRQQPRHLLRVEAPLQEPPG